ncbi:MAG: chemotaxis protein CheW [Pseudomonadota bacterium]
MQDTILENAERNLDVVAFRVAGQDFCFDLASVREIRGWTSTTALPHAQPFVKGVINLRGSVVPVIDLSQRLGFGMADPGARHVIIIAVISNQTVGLLAEVVSDILTVSEADLQPIPEIVDETVRQFISGVLIQDDKMIRRLELGMILDQEGKHAA